MGVGGDGDRRPRRRRDGAGGCAGSGRRRVPCLCRGQRGHRPRACRGGRGAQRVTRRDPHGSHGGRDRGHDRRLRHRRRHEDRPDRAVTLFDVLSRQRRLVYLLVALASIAGVWAAATLPSAIYPELTFARVTIVATRTSLGARQQLFGVSRPIEEAVSIVPGVTRVRSRTIRGGTEINVDFSPSTEMLNALQEVRARVDQIVPDLPAGGGNPAHPRTPSLAPPAHAP